jgi:hypothetical protein
MLNVMNKSCSKCYLNMKSHLGNVGKFIIKCWNLQSWLNKPKNDVRIHIRIVKVPKNLEFNVQIMNSSLKMW